MFLATLCSDNLREVWVTTKLFRSVWRFSQTPLIFCLHPLLAHLSRYQLPLILEPPFSQYLKEEAEFNESRHAADAQAEATAKELRRGRARAWAAVAAERWDTQARARLLKEEKAVLEADIAEQVFD